MKKYIYIDTNIISDFKSFTPDKWQSFNKVQKNITSLFHTLIYST